ncbi:histidine kinase [Kitasatospora sp. NPDC093806]|uniref:sensor histidine kinase n=1 Tax=Kitasatospora sp. NPDC093806 TaxID=3155075 RepID=UPI0034371CE5
MPETDRRLTALAVLVTALLVPVPLAPNGGRSAALEAALPAVLAVTVAALRGLLGPRAVPFAVGGVLAASLAVDLGYQGRAQLVLPWVPFELAAHLVLLAWVLRRAPLGQAAALGPPLALVALALPLRYTLHHPPSDVEQGVLLCTITAAPVLATAGVAVHLRLQDARRARAVRAARREQRLEVARDLHDFVAHEVTGILLEVQAAQVSGYDAEQTRELLDRLEAAGLRALESMDDTLRTLRESDGRPFTEPPPTRVFGLADLPDLIDRFLASGTLTGSLELDPGLAGAASPEVEDAVYRLVLEALTNIRRHAPGATRLAVRAGLGDAGLLVSVTDDGGGSASRVRHRSGGGTGLLALTERVRSLGGDASAGPHEGGWRVKASLPLA